MVLIDEIITFPLYQSHIYRYVMKNRENNNNQKILQIVIAVAVGVATFFLVQYILNR